MVITSDRGLCGSFNSHIIRVAEKMMAQLEGEGKKVSLVCVGKKGARYFNKTGKVRKAYRDIMGNFQMFNAREIAQDVAAAFLAGESDECRLIYGEFKSVAVQRPTSEQLLPITPAASEGEHGIRAPRITSMSRHPAKSWKFCCRFI